MYYTNYREYAEIIEARLKKLGLTVDLLFPNEDVPLTRVLGNIASRGCLYAIVIAPTNKEHHSLTLNILHGLPQGKIISLKFFRDVFFVFIFHIFRK